MAFELRKAERDAVPAQGRGPLLCGRSAQPARTVAVLGDGEQAGGRPGRGALIRSLEVTQTG